MVIPFMVRSHRYPEKKHCSFMKNGIHKFAVSELEYELIHPSLRGMYRMYKSIKLY
jgi:hypothetical protein